MLSYREYRRLKESNNNSKNTIVEDVDNLFNSWTSEVTGLIVSPKYAENLIDFCESSVTSDSKWKTIQEHRMIRQLPVIVRETLKEESAQARLFINEAKYQIKKILKEAEEVHGDPWAQLQNRNAQAAKDIEREVEAIFQQLKTDILHTYGSNRGQAPSGTPIAGAPSRTGGPMPQKPGLFGRAKNWLKSVWQGATGGDPNLRKFALSKGYAADPRYQQDPHAWKDPKKHPEFFPKESEFAELENLLKEDFEDARKVFHSIFSKHKSDLLKLIAKYALQTFPSDPADKMAPVVAPRGSVPPAAEEEEEEDKGPKIITDPKEGFGRIPYNDYGHQGLVDALRNMTPDGTIELDGHKVKEIEQTRSHVIFGSETHRTKITHKRWEAAKEALKSPPEAPPEAPEGKETSPEEAPEGKEASPEELASTQTDVTDPNYIPSPDDEEDDGEQPDDQLGVDDNDDIPDSISSGEDQAGAGDDQKDDPTDLWMKALEKAKEEGKPAPEFNPDGIYDDDEEDEKDVAVPAAGRHPHYDLSTEKIKEIIEEDKATHKGGFNIKNMKSVEKDEDGNLAFKFDKGLHPISFHKVGSELIAFYNKEKDPTKPPKYFFKDSIKKSDFQKYVTERLGLEDLEKPKEKVKTSFTKGFNTSRHKVTAAQVDANAAKRDAL